MQVIDGWCCYHGNVQARYYIISQSPTKIEDCCLQILSNCFVLDMELIHSRNIFDLGWSWTHAYTQRTHLYRMCSICCPASLCWAVPGHFTWNSNTKIQEPMLSLERNRSCLITKTEVPRKSVSIYYFESVDTNDFTLFILRLKKSAKLVITKQEEVCQSVSMDSPNHRVFRGSRFGEAEQIWQITFVLRVTRPIPPDFVCIKQMRGNLHWSRFICISEYAWIIDKYENNSRDHQCEIWDSFYLGRSTYTVQSSVWLLMTIRICVHARGWDLASNRADVK